MSRTDEKAFKVGHTYRTRSMTNYDRIMGWTIVSRTAKFVTLLDIDQGIEKRVGVQVHEGVEVCSPLGRYSMSPSIWANREQVTV